MWVGKAGRRGGRRERTREEGAGGRDVSVGIEGVCLPPVRHRRAAPASVDSVVSAHSGCGLPNVQIRVPLLVLLTTPLLEPLLEPAAPAAAVEVSH